MASVRAVLWIYEPNEIQTPRIDYATNQTTEELQIGARTHCRKYVMRATDELTAHSQVQNEEQTNCILMQFMYLKLKFIATAADCPCGRHTKIKELRPIANAPIFSIREFYFRSIDISLKVKFKRLTPEYVSAPMRLCGAVIGDGTCEKR